MDESQRIGCDQKEAQRQFIIYLTAVHVFVVICATSHRDAVERLGVSKIGAATVMIAPSVLGEHGHYDSGHCVRDFYYDQTPGAAFLAECWRVQSAAGIEPVTI